MRKSEQGSPDERTARSVARRIGCKVRDIVKVCGLVDPSEDPIRAIHERFNGVYLGDLPEDFHVPLARIIGTPSGPHRELFWAVDEVEIQIAFWVNGQVIERGGLLPPRIFVEARTFDRDGERDAKDLLRLLGRRRTAETEDHRRARKAVEIALRAMRPSERYLLLGRLRGKRGSPETTWYELAHGPTYEYGTGSVALTKEVFKVSLDEFLHEYARITNELIKSGDKDF